MFRYLTKSVTRVFSRVRKLMKNFQKKFILTIIKIIFYLP